MKRIRAAVIIGAAVTAAVLLTGCSKIKELQYNEYFPFGVNTTKETRVAKEAIEYMNNKYKDDHFTLNHVFESTTIILDSEKYPEHYVEVDCSYDKKTKIVSYRDTYLHVKFDNEMQKEAESFSRDLFFGTGMEVQSVSAGTTLYSHDDDSEKTTFEEVRKRRGNGIGISVRFDDTFKYEEIEERVKKVLSNRGLTASVNIVFKKENEEELEAICEYNFYMHEPEDAYADTNESEWRNLNE